MISRRDAVGYGAAAIAAALTSKSKFLPVTQTDGEKVDQALTVDHAGSHGGQIVSIDLTKDIEPYLTRPLDYAKAYQAVYCRRQPDGTDRFSVVRAIGVRVSDPRDPVVLARWAAVLENIDNKHKIIAVLGGLAQAIEIATWPDGYEPMTQFMNAAAGKPHHVPELVRRGYVMVSYIVLDEDDVKLETDQVCEYDVHEAQEWTAFKTLV